MHVILTGATGLVGSAVLDAMIRSKHITKISILSRRPVDMAHAAQDPRIAVIHHSDFQTYDSSLLQQLSGARACVWALGVSQTKVSNDEYVKITKDYALAAAEAFSKIPAATTTTTTTTTPRANPAAAIAAKSQPEPGREPDKDKEPFRFVYVSGEGATQKPGFFSAVFARVKGQTESELSALMAQRPLSLRVESVRPAFVDARGHQAILPYIPDPGALFKGLIAVASQMVKVMPDTHSPTPMLGDFLTNLALGRLDDKFEGSGSFRLGPSWIVPNAGFRRMMGV